MDSLAIAQKFEGKLIGHAQMKRAVCDTLANFPTHIINFVTANIWVACSFDDAWGFTFDGRDLKDKYLIFLSDELFSQGIKQIRYTISHEIGHVLLNHRNAISGPQTKEEIKRQEKEADAFANYFLFFPKDQRQ